MSTRTERKATAAAQRREWCTRWSAIGIAALQSGKSSRDAIAAIGADADQLVIDMPQKRSEIMRALDEFLMRMRAAIARALT